MTVAVRETSLEKTLNASLQWINRLLAEQGQVIKRANDEITAARAGDRANPAWCIRDAKVTVRSAEHRIAELKDTKAGFVASIIRFRASRACWPDETP